MALDFVSLIIFLIGAFLVYHGGKNWHKYHRIVSMPLTRVKDLKDGQIAKIRGEATGKILKSPFSGRDCVFYIVKITEGIWWKLEAHIKHEWEEKSADKIVISTDNAKIETEVKNIEILALNKQLECENTIDVPQLIKIYEKKIGIEPTTDSFTTLLRTFLRMIMLTVMSFILITLILTEATQYAALITKILISILCLAYLYKKGFTLLVKKRMTVDRPFRQYEEYIIMPSEEIFFVGKVVIKNGNFIFETKEQIFAYKNENDVKKLKLNNIVVAVLGSLLLYFGTNLLA